MITSNLIALDSSFFMLTLGYVPRSGPLSFSPDVKIAYRE